MHPLGCPAGTTVHIPPGERVVMLYFHLHTSRSLPLYNPPSEAAAALDSYSECPGSHQSPWRISKRSTPLHLDIWARLLTATLPDSAFSSYVVNSLAYQCFPHLVQPLPTPRGSKYRNMPSALVQHAVVSAYIDNKVTVVA